MGTLVLSGGNAVSVSCTEVESGAGRTGNLNAVLSSNLRGGVKLTTLTSVTGSAELSAAGLLPVRIVTFERILSVARR